MIVEQQRTSIVLEESSKQLQETQEQVCYT